MGSGDFNPLDPGGSSSSNSDNAVRVLPVNNYAANFLRLSVCDVRVDDATYNQFGVVRTRRCRWCFMNSLYRKEEAERERARE